MCTVGAEISDKFQILPAVQRALDAGIDEVAMFGTLDNPIANSVANQARLVLQANPDITVMFAPYDEFAKGVKIAVDEAGEKVEASVIAKPLMFPAVF